MMCRRVLLLISMLTQTSHMTLTLLMLCRRQCHICTSPMMPMTLLQMTLTEHETRSSPMTLMLTTPMSPMTPIALTCRSC